MITVRLLEEVAFFEPLDCAPVAEDDEEGMGVDEDVGVTGALLRLIEGEPLDFEDKELDGRATSTLS